MQTTQKLFDIVRDKKNMEKRERKATKNERKSNSNNKCFFIFTFLSRKIYVLLESIFGKT